MMVKIGNAWVEPGSIVAVAPTVSEGYRPTPTCSVFLRSGQRMIIGGQMELVEEDLIEAGLIGDPESERPPALNAEEEAELKHLYALGYLYLARDQDGRLFAFQEVPKREGAYWSDHSTVAAHRMSAAFGFIDEGDAEPWAIEDLL